MTPVTIIDALELPPDARIDQRIPKKLLLEHGAITAADKHQINDSIEEIQWLAVLKPATIGIPVFRDEVREYLEISILSLTLRAGVGAARITELTHRAIPYPVFLIQRQDQQTTLSLAHLRWSQGQTGQTVLDGPLNSVPLDAEAPFSGDLLASLSLSKQPRHHLYALYQGWIECLEAHMAAQHSGGFTPADSPATAERRRIALREHRRLTEEIVSLRARAAKEKQLNRRVELNLQIKQLECRLTEAASQL
jgi:hypothetical protein